MHARRALLYVPGDDLKKINKAASLGVDSVCLDMEDGVALNRKIEARQTIAQALGRVDFGATERLARINPVGSGLEIDDLWAVLPSRPDGIVLPKVDDPDQVNWASREMAAFERQAGLPVGSLALIVLVETPRGVINLPHIAAAASRLQALIFGAEDLAGSLGATRTPEAWEVHYARSAVVLHAAAFNLQAIDMVYIDFHDISGLRREALQGAQMGFAGKQIIHPNQVAPVQESFTPTEEEARRRRAPAAGIRRTPGIGQRRLCPG